MNYFSLYLKGLICFCLLFITMDSHALSIDKGYRQNKIKDLALITREECIVLTGLRINFSPMWYISLQMDIKTGYLTDSCFWSSQTEKAVALQHATQIKMQEKKNGYGY